MKCEWSEDSIPNFVSTTLRFKTLVSHETLFFNTDFPTSYLYTGCIFNGDASPRPTPTVLGFL